jgi:hypothetical protein
MSLFTGISSAAECHRTTLATEGFLLLIERNRNLAVAEDGKQLVSRVSAAVQTNEFKWAPKFTPPTDTFTFTTPNDSKLVSFGDLRMTD